MACKLLNWKLSQVEGKGFAYLESSIFLLSLLNLEFLSRLLLVFSVHLWRDTIGCSIPFYTWSREWEIHHAIVNSIRQSSISTLDTGIKPELHPKNLPEQNQHFDQIDQNQLLVHCGVCGMSYIAATYILCIFIFFKLFVYQNPCIFSPPPSQNFFSSSMTRRNILLTKSLHNIQTK